MLTNLCGDARNFPKQFDFIRKTSFMSFVLLNKALLENEEVKKILESLSKVAGRVAGRVAILLVDSKRYKTSKINSFLLTNDIYTFTLKDKTSAIIQNEIRSHICKNLRNAHNCVCISECITTARELSINVDEDNEDCKKGKELATSVINSFSNMALKEVKSKLLPLQGSKMWCAWADHDKEFHRHYKRKQCNIPMSQYNQHKNEQKLDIHDFQLHGNFSPLVDVFLLNLVQYTGKIRNYFLHWLKLFLENFSRKELPGIQNQYHDTRMKLSKLCSDDNTTRQQHAEKLKYLNDLVIHAAFGLEHLFRELSQIYEAIIESTQVPLELKQKVDCLPQISAEVLIEGHALELMDGDALHVPVTWIKAILKYLSKLFEGRKIVVFSIIGIQSTGKSTLLNTVFGVRFDVGAGRCTRGVFAQLIPLDEESKLKYNCDFILVVDAEGLHAPELQFGDSEHHDNELATFVIGIADFTIINVYGEAPADLSDILQIVVHALIRMKEVNKTLDASLFIIMLQNSLQMTKLKWEDIPFMIA